MRFECFECEFSAKKISDLIDHQLEFGHRGAAVEMNDDFKEIQEYTSSILQATSVQNSSVLKDTEILEFSNDSGCSSEASLENKAFPCKHCEFVGFSAMQLNVHLHIFFVKL